MKKSKLLYQDTEQIIRTKVDNETRNYFISVWWKYHPILQSPSELAESVSREFQIECTEDQVINCFSLDIEERDIKQQVSNLGIIYK